MYKTVFILGAGASADAGVPVMRDFLDRARDFYSSGQLLRNERRYFEDVFKAIHELKGASFNSNLDLNNIEAVYSAFDMGKLLGQLGSNTHNKIESLNISIQKLIGITIDLSTTLTLNPKGKINVKGPYHSFVKNIKQKYKDQNSLVPSIITFNYDVALDYSLHCEYQSFSCCLDEKPEPGIIPLLKLHGSVNWGLGEHTNIIKSWNMRELLQSGLVGAPDNLRPEVPFIVARHLQNANKNPSLGMSGPVLVPPTWSKNEHHAKIGRIWQMAAKELSEAEAIYVIGYSLPETDMFFRFLFALATHSESSIRRFWVFDPSQSVKNRFLSLLGPGLKDEPRFHYEQCNFIKAIQYLSENI
ncbi:hypothetical protein [Desulfoferula mesophila]|uniref:SIR2-like domain-containing protein n=1 Tax=Desulfoferula mesophila TaxID=3058419 RepID=A0AAU9EER0_9BACT|nr:hypothetical protein FAK_08050 [Desulfoferula mesophilus]